MLRLRLRVLVHFILLENLLFSLFLHPLLLDFGFSLALLLLALLLLLSLLVALVLLLLGGGALPVLLLHRLVLEIWLCLHQSSEQLTGEPIGDVLEVVRGGALLIHSFQHLLVVLQSLQPQQLIRFPPLLVLLLHI